MTSVLRSIPATCLALAATLAACPAPTVGQVTVLPSDTSVVEEAGTDALRAARAAQARFERRRMQFLPLTIWSSGGACDERVGRFCSWYGEGEWYPEPEAEQIVEARRALLVELDSLQRSAPAEDWILAQRVWYRAEGGDWDGALATARRCGEVEAWWCSALEGFALHGGGRFREAQAAFDRTLAAMPRALAEEWRWPERSVDRETRDLLDELRNADPDSADAALDLLWTLADPLYLVEGNDRRTAHYARWTYATLRDGARNPFRIRWGRDLEELSVRHGWELGWERAPRPGAISRDDAVIGHKHPEGRDYMPDGESLTDPGAATPEMLEASRTRPRSLYAPEYAPVLLPMEGQIAAFPRTGEVVIVATTTLPPDTSFHSSHTHPIPWLEPGDQAEMPDRGGLVAIEVESGREHRVVRREIGRAVALGVPEGRYVISAEAWSPPLRRAGRTRLGMVAHTAPDDIATLSDIVLLQPMGDGATTLEGALDLVLPRPVLRPGQPFAIGWEVAGLGLRPETLLYEVSVTKTDQSALRRLGQFLRLTSRPRPVRLSWEEPAPERPGHVFRTLDLDVPDLEPGRYEVRLTLRSRGRSDAVTTLSFRVDPSGGSF